MRRATTRLRRAGVAGIASLALVGASLVTAGSASATLSGIAVTIGADSATTLYQGSNSQATGSVDLFVSNKFNAADTIKVTFGANGACTTNTGNVTLNGTPTVTIGDARNMADTAAGDDADTKPAVTVTVNDNATPACAALGIKDSITIKFGVNSTGVVGDRFKFSVTGIKLNVGSTYGTAGDSFDAVVTASAGSVLNPVDGIVAIGTLANTKLAVSSITTAHWGDDGVALGTLTASDVNEKHINTAIVYTLDNGATWNADAKPALAGPAGLTWTFAISGGGSVLTATPAGTWPSGTAANTFKLTGAVIDDVDSGVTGVTATYGGTTIGAKQTVVVAAAVERFAGSDRYATAARLFTEGGFGGNHGAVLASGANFPDALSASVLAGEMGTGILLTDPNTLPLSTKNAILNRNVTNVAIIGGYASVSKAIEDQIAALKVGGTNIAVTRYAGADRYETNAAVNLELTGSNRHTAVVTTGEKAWDALSVGPLVMDMGYSLVLTPAAALAQGSRSSLIDNDVTKVIILGDTNSVSANVEQQIKDLGITVAYRIAGADRTATSALIAKWGVTGTSSDAFPKTTAYAALKGTHSFNGTGAFLANGSNFPDALAAAPLAYHWRLPILLTGSPTVLGAGIPSYLGSSGSYVEYMAVLGLNASVSNAVVNSAIAALS